MHFYDMILKLLLGSKNLGAGAEEEANMGEWIEVEVLLHHQDDLHPLLLLLLLLLHLRYRTRLVEDKTHKNCRT